MAHIIIPKAHQSAASDAPVEGTPEHFLAVCRGHVDRVVQNFGHTIEGVVIPSDGLWMVNGLAALPGQVRDIAPGDKVVYHHVVRHADNDTPVEQVAVARLGGDRRADPVTGALLHDYQRALMLAARRRPR